MKICSVTKLDKRNKTASKIVMMTTCQKTVTSFPIFRQFGAIPKPDSGRIVCKTYVFINTDLLSYKN